MPRDPSTAVTYATEAAYDSDGQEDSSSSKASSSGSSGVLLGFDDGPLTHNKADGSYIDERTLDVSRIGGKPVSFAKILIVEIILTIPLPAGVPAA